MTPGESSMKRLLMAAIAAAPFATPAFAQSKAPHFPPDVIAPAADARAQADAWKRWADDFSREMRASMSTMFADRVASRRLVNGAPYSARVVTETNQALADGNVISHRHEAAVYRDGEGRTRQETTADGRRTSIVIDDPVEDKHYVLLPDFKRAIEAPGTRTKHARSKQVVKLDGREIRVEDGKVTIDGKEAADTQVIRTKSGREVRIENGRVTIDGKEPGTGAGSGSRVEISRTEGADGLPREEVRVQVVRAGGDATIPVPPIPPAPPLAPGSVAAPPPVPPVPPVPPIPGVHTMRFESTASLGKGVTTALGTKDFDGVKAEGKQTVWTIPAGEIGNRKPISVTSESWYSPELQVTVYSRYNDPRTGETLYRLAGIRRGEPAPELFRVPADYELRRRGG